MSKRLLIAVAAALIGTVSASFAQTVSVGHSYTATPYYVSGTTGYLPTINTTGSFLSSPFTETLTVGQTTTPSTFIEVSPVGGGSNVGTEAGYITVGFTFTEQSGASVTGVYSSAGANAATLSNGVVSVNANYLLFYGNQTDCITWDTTACTANDVTTTIGDTLVVTFADNAVLDVNLYNWSDWTMMPNISFKLACAPGSSACMQSQIGGQLPAPEPASIALFGTALAGLGVLRRRRNGAKHSDSH